MFKFTAFGIAFGAMFPVCAILFDKLVLGRPETGLYDMVAANPIHMIVALAPFVLGATFYVIGRKQDALRAQLDRTRTAEAGLSRMVNTDILTGYGNRHRFVEDLRRHLTDGTPRQKTVSVLLMDLDNFKFINDTLGHHVGDELLQGLADRITGTVPENVDLYRLGGDEFILLSESIVPPEEIAQAILDAIVDVFEIGGTRVAAAASIGIADLRPSDTSETEALRRADLALYDAKKTFGNCYVVFSYDMAEQACERMTMEQELREALDGDQFFIEFQPIVNSVDFTTKGYEALVRWRHPERGIVSPNDFISIAEVSGLIVQLGEHVLRLACTEAMTWPQPLKVSVNVSAEQFKHREFYNQVVFALEDTGLPPDRLCLEITESLFISDIDFVSHTFDRLRALGIRFALDDFGTGYSSINHLRQLELDVLKLDRSFVSKALTDPREAGVIQTIIELGRVFDLTITVEGVETQAQLDMMRGQGVECLQGFYFSKPISAAQVLADLSAEPLRIDAKVG